MSNQGDVVEAYEDTLNSKMMLQVAAIAAMSALIQRDAIVDDVNCAKKAMSFAKELVNEWEKRK